MLSKTLFELGQKRNVTMFEVTEYGKKSVRKFVAYKKGHETRLMTYAHARDTLQHYVCTYVEDIRAIINTSWRNDIFQSRTTLKLFLPGETHTFVSRML